MKRITAALSLLIFVTITSFLYAQQYRILDGSTVFGTPTKPDDSAIFQVESKTQGFLPPRMTTAERDAIPSPEKGLIVFNLDSGAIEAWNGTAWSSNIGGVTGLGTDECLARWDGTGAPTLQDSSLCVTDAGIADGLTSFDTDSLTLNGSAVSVNDILDEDGMASDSDTALATQQSIKAYTDTGDDAQVDGIASSTDNASVRWDGTTGKLVQDSSVTIDDSGVVTSNGQTINGNIQSVEDITYTDGALGGLRIEADTADDSDVSETVIRGGGGPGAVRGASWGVYGNEDSTNPGSFVGRMGDAAGSKFSLLDDGAAEVFSVDNTTKETAVTSLNIGSTTSVNDILDEDDLVSDSDTSLATQQSIKAYVDSGSTGDVQGPASATNNAITRWDGNTGKLVQDSSVTVDDSGIVTSNGNTVNGRLEAVSTTEASNPCPDMTTTERNNIGSPTEGDCIFNTTEEQLEFYDGTEWLPIGSGGITDWTASTDYDAGDAIKVDAADGYKVYEAETTFTSGGSFDASNWFELSRSKSDSGKRLNDPGFEFSVSEWSCTNASVSLVNSNTWNKSQGAAEITFSADGGFCDLTKNFTGEDSEKKLIGARVDTTAANVEFDYIKGGSKIEAGENFEHPGEGGYIPFSVQVLSDGVTGLRITGNNTEVARVDDAKIESGGFQTGASKACAGELDCENTLTVNVSNDGTTASGKAGENSPGVWWDSITRIDTGKVTVDYTSLGLTSIPSITVDSYSSGNRFNNVAPPSLTSVTIQITNSATSDRDEDFTLYLTKQDSDHKSLQEKGVHMTESSGGAELVVSNKSSNTNQSVGTSLTTVEFGDVESSEFIDWDTTNNVGTLKKSGKFLISGNLIFFNASNSPLLYWSIEKNTGTGFSEISQHPCFSILQSNRSRASHPNCSFPLKLKKGDKFRVVAISSTPNTKILDDGVLNGKTRSPRLTVVPILDREYVISETVGANPERYCIIEDRKPSGTDGGTSSTTPVARDLNTQSGDCSYMTPDFGNNKFKLKPGKYRIEWSAPAYTAGRHQSCLHDGSSCTKTGTSSWNKGNSPEAQTTSNGNHILTISSESSYSIRHEAQTSTADKGWGVNSSGSLSITTEEIYTTVLIERLR